MLVDAATFDVDDPIFWDSGAGVELGFGAEIVVERRVADFDDQGDVAGHGVISQLTGGPIEEGDVGFWFAGGIVFGRYVDAARREDAFGGGSRPLASIFWQSSRVHIMDLRARKLAGASMLAGMFVV